MKILTLPLLLITLAIMPTSGAEAFLHKREKPAEITYTETMWDQLVPEDAFNFLQDYVDAEDVWSDQGFLDAVEKADRMIVDAMNGQAVRIPGFMVPIELDADRVTDFMIVPTPGACIHVPPPPPNQTILAAAKRPVTVRDLYQPIWVEGRIFVESGKNELAETSYRLEVDNVTKYDGPGTMHGASN